MDFIVKGLSKAHDSQRHWLKYFVSLGLHVEKVVNHRIWLVVFIRIPPSISWGIFAPHFCFDNKLCLLILFCVISFFLCYIWRLCLFLPVAFTPHLKNWFVKEKSSVEIILVDLDFAYFIPFGGHASPVPVTSAHSSGSQSNNRECSI